MSDKHEQEAMQALYHSTYSNKEAEMSISDKAINSLASVLGVTNDVDATILMLNAAVRIERLTTELAEAKREAEYLASSLWKSHYKESSPNWGLCDTVAGVITQIDNMVTGVVDRAENAERELSAISISLSAVVGEGMIAHQLDRIYDKLEHYRGGVEVGGIVQFAEQLQKTIINVDDQSLPHELLGQRVKALILSDERRMSNEQG